MRRKIIQIKLHDKLLGNFVCCETGTKKRRGRDSEREKGRRETGLEKIENALNSVHIFHGTQCV